MKRHHQNMYRKQKKTAVFRPGKNPEENSGGECAYRPDEHECAPPDSVDIERRSDVAEAARKNVSKPLVGARAEKEYGRHEHSNRSLARV